MTLRKIISDLSTLSDDLVIYATKQDTWQVDARAMLVRDEDASAIGELMEDLAYFLEVDIAKEVIEVWSDWRDGRIPTEEERLDAVSYYASHDSYLD